MTIKKGMPNVTVKIYFSMKFAAAVFLTPGR